MAVRDDFAAGEVLAAADLNDTFASKVDYALPTNAQTGTAYTFVAADAEKLTTASNGSAVTLTVPPASSVAWPDNTVLRVVNYGAGAVTIAGGSGVTVTNTATTVAQYGAAVAIRTGSDAWTVVPFGGGDVPAATVSSPAATGQYTDTGITYDYYTFTSSGSLTVDTAGFADILVIGGGGAGGNRRGGGGGAGGYLAVTDAYLPAGSLTVTVGAGGAAAPDLVRPAGQNGTSSRIESYYGIGGGGGGQRDGLVGGSGGGGGSGTSADPGGNGVPSQGNNGGDNSGGGGGAGADGSDGLGGNGGNGTASEITGSSVTRSGGGGGGNSGGNSAGSGGSGGGGAGTNDNTTATSGTANTGGGGGAGGYVSEPGGTGGAGGSGVVIVRVKV